MLRNTPAGCWNLFAVEFRAAMFRAAVSDAAILSGLSRRLPCAAVCWLPGKLPSDTWVAFSSDAGCMSDCLSKEAAPAGSASSGLAGKAVSAAGAVAGISITSAAAGTEVAGGVSERGCLRAIASLAAAAASDAALDFLPDCHSTNMVGPISGDAKITSAKVLPSFGPH